MRGKKKVHHRRHSKLYDEEKRWKTTPLGVRILLIYISSLALFYLVLGIIIPTNVFFGYIFTGILARALNFVFLIIIGFMVYGFIMKKRWAGKLAIFWFGLEILNLLVSLMLGKTLLQDGIVVILITLFVLGINAIILYYLIAKKEYFLDLRKHHTTYVDKIFVFGIFSMVFFAIIATTTFGIKTYKETIIFTDKIIGELNGMDYENAEMICSFKKGKDKDVCYMVMATAYKGAPKSLCNNIEYEFYKLTCVQAVIL